ncbi:efflux RND transporter periplasmic adaptor subunit [Cyanobium sp. Aljojuca 7D2]|uniref:efflux RND transporter periplasmic adaptor subunit n=1 Tax=Cyanobium sp. Aljojuca 7D2 TaxID=2823698 RepID=UPI0020CF06DC|nr:efflux RND transporter periplasmic adaptor subunit [Cyanobium sp. Aljojuca 7D2]MCP9892114.1 efflux RND transporter periplasmic adaptor subunit [Cyanobium sp. Aljojuca 7D2]
MAIQPCGLPILRRPLFKVGLAMILGVPVTGCGLGGSDQGRERGPLPVETQAVEVGRFSDVVNTSSTLEALDAVQLAAQAGGRIERLIVRQGEQVRAGQLLVVLDQTQASADVARLRAAVATNLLNWQRYDDLVKQGAASAIQRDEFRQTYIASREQLVASEADLAFRDLRAPISGIIGDLRVKAGDVISASSPFASIIRNSQLLARIEVPAIYSNRVRLGQTVILLDPSTGTPMAEAPVRSIDPVVSSGAQSLLVKAAFNNSDLRLRAGLRTRIRLVLDSREHPFVPFVAVTQQGAQRIVYQVGTLAELRRNPGPVDLKPLAQRPPTTPVALQTPVQLGSLQNNRYPVFKGLDPGRRVITSNLMSLRHGMPIQPLP